MELQLVTVNVSPTSSLKIGFHKRAIQHFCINIIESQPLQEQHYLYLHGFFKDITLGCTEII